MQCTYHFLILRLVSFITLFLFQDTPHVFSFDIGLLSLRVDSNQQDIVSGLHVIDKTITTTLSTLCVRIFSTNLVDGLSDSLNRIAWRFSCFKQFNDGCNIQTNAAVFLTQSFELAFKRFSITNRR